MIVSLTIAIPTYGRDQELLDTLATVRTLRSPRTELIVIDQSDKHAASVEQTLASWNRDRTIRLINLSTPSIPSAMNIGLIEATGDIVLFLDDDVVPEPELVEAHIAAHRSGNGALVAGRVIQPWHEIAYSTGGELGGFASDRPGRVEEFMGGNFSIDRKLAIELGGFDENFVGVAYNFEAEFAHRLRRAGHQIYFEPKACIHHLKVGVGGTRTFGEHLTTARGYHAVGAYYYILKTWEGWRSFRALAFRPIRSIVTRHHLRRPWWIPITLLAELKGLVWALSLTAKGPKYIDKGTALG